MKKRTFDYHVVVESNESASKWYSKRTAAIKYAIKMSEIYGGTTFYEYKIDENGKHILISQSAV